MNNCSIKIQLGRMYAQGETPKKVLFFIVLDLPTVKVYNMLEEYGDDTRDLYPSKHMGKAAHHRKTSLPNVKEGTTKTNR